MDRKSNEIVTTFAYLAALHLNGFWVWKLNWTFWATNMKCKNELVTLVLLNDVSLEFSLLATLLLLHISYNCTFSTLIEGFLRWSDPWWSEKKLKNFITNWWLEFKDKRPIHVITETYLFNVFLLTINTNNIAVDLTFTTSLRQPSKVGLKNRMQHLSKVFSEWRNKNMG